MKETEAKPALRISHIVYGRQVSGNRVLYLLDPKGQVMSDQSQSLLSSSAGANGSFQATPFLANG